MTGHSSGKLSFIGLGNVNGFRTKGSYYRCDWQMGPIGLGSGNIQVLQTINANRSWTNRSCLQCTGKWKVTGSSIIRWSPVDWAKVLNEDLSICSIDVWPHFVKKNSAAVRSSISPIYTWMYESNTGWRSTTKYSILRVYSFISCFIWFSINQPNYQLFNLFPIIGDAIISYK